MEVWHCCLVYVGEENIKKLKAMETGIKVNLNSIVSIYSPYLKGNQHRHPSNKSRDKATDLLD
jgi:hypothetical protein